MKALSEPIDLGNMSDIAQIIQGYYPEGLGVEVTASIIAEKQFK